MQQHAGTLRFTESALRRHSGISNSNIPASWCIATVIRPALPVQGNVIGASDQSPDTASAAAPRQRIKRLPIAQCRHSIQAIASAPPQRLCAGFTPHPGLVHSDFMRLLRIVPSPAPMVHHGDCMPRSIPVTRHGAAHRTA
ncbi:hypothetical protein [Xanthomonas arboricola]|uniref:hypothetical protein n=1 Tax=Xanthomonas arboricola TaxID=56448 RepID=UPI0015C8AFBF